MKTGLTNEEVLKSKQKYGTNIITTKKQDGFFKLLLLSLSDPIIKILLIALAIKTVFLFKNFDWFETLGIVIAIFLASFISTISELGSEKAFKKLQEETSKIKTKVKRNNKIQEIPSSEVVVDDIVVLYLGDLIPADGVIVGGNITVDESIITGETKEIKKEVNNVVYKGTTVYSNQALMQVTKIGDKTFYGTIANELQEKDPISPLKTRLTKLASQISKIGYIGAILVTISYLFSNIVLKNNFNFELIKQTITDLPLMISYLLYALTLSVTIIIVSVPEGLPMMITLVLSSNMKRMLKNNVLVRKLIGIETSGNINILFTDKTGTITKGKLEAIKFIDGVLNEYKDINNPLQEILQLSLIYNNSSSFVDNKAINGNITDRCLKEFVKKDKLDSVEVLSNIPFDSKNKFSSELIKTPKKINLIKGAKEKILPHCSYYYDTSNTKKVLNNKQEINNKISELEKQGIRIIILATSDYETYKFANLTLVGIIAIKDEIRDNVKESIQLVSDASIQTVMITGDNINTASSIAKEVGLIKKNSDIILTSDELNKMSEEELQIKLKDIRVVARALPSDKSKLIRVAQSLDLVVGMTGDGVNDAPALKRANVGFALGSGTEVAKEASDIILLDDNFLSIVNSILFGRTIFKSIRKFIIVQLTINLCALTLSIIGPFINIKTPITVMQMLWINMIMDTLAGLAFSFEPALKEYMKEKSKTKNEPIINKYMINQILYTGLYSSFLCILFLKVPYIRNMFISESHLYTAFFGVLIFIDIFNSFSARTHRLNLLSNILKNKIFMFVILFITITQIIILYYGGDLFRSYGLTLKEFIIMLLIAFSVIPFDWIRKIVFRLKNGKIGV